LSADFHLLSEFALRKKLLAWLHGATVDKLEQLNDQTSRYWVFTVIIVRGLRHGSGNHINLDTSGCEAAMDRHHGSVIVLADKRGDARPGSIGAGFPAPMVFFGYDLALKTAKAHGLRSTS
jgi:hypothetical protein